MYNTVDDYAYKPCYCLGRIYLELGHGTVFFAIFSCQIQVKTKKNFYLSAEPLALCQMLYVKSVSGYYIAFIKRLNESLSYQLPGTQREIFPRGTKIEEGPPNLVKHFHKIKKRTSLKFGSKKRFSLKLGPIF